MKIIKTIRKILYICFGFIFLGLGAIGIVLPLVPTTPLLLLASVCFVKGSDRFARWFKGTTIYKRHLESFVTNRAMTNRQKIVILLFADVMIAVPLILLDSLIIKAVLLLIVTCKYYYFIYKIKTVTPEMNKLTSIEGRDLDDRR